MVGVQRADHGDVVDALGHVREQRADLGAALAVLVEFPLRPLEEDPLVARPVADFRVIELDLLADVGGQPGLGIERVDVRDAAGHEQEDDVLRLGRKMRARLGASGSRGSRGRSSASSSGSNPRHQQRTGDRRRSEPRRREHDLRHAAMARASAWSIDMQQLVAAQQDPGIGLPTLPPTAPPRAALSTVGGVLLQERRGLLAARPRSTVRPNRIPQAAVQPRRGRRQRRPECRAANWRPVRAGRDRSGRTRPASARSSVALRRAGVRVGAVEQGEERLRRLRFCIT